MADKPKKNLKQVNETIAKNMGHLSKMMADRLYDARPMTQAGEIVDTKKCFNVVFCGRDMIVHALTLWDDTDHDNIATTIKLQMAQDARMLELKVFDKNHVDDFIEAIQDAAIEGAAAIPVIHDDEGFQLLRAKNVEVVGKYHPYRSTMVNIVREHKVRPNLQNVDAIIPNDSWVINVEKTNRHYEWLDAVRTVFSVVGTNSKFNNYTNYRYGDVMRQENGYYLIGNVLAILGAVGAYEDPGWASAILNMLTDNTITVETAKRWREQDHKSPGTIDMYDFYE